MHNSPVARKGESSSSSQKFLLPPRCTKRKRAVIIVDLGSAQMCSQNTMLNAAHMYSMKSNSIAQTPLILRDSARNWTARTNTQKRNLNAAIQRKVLETTHLKSVSPLCTCPHNEIQINTSTEAVWIHCTCAKVRSRATHSPPRIPFARTFLPWPPVTFATSPHDRQLTQSLRSVQPFFRTPHRSTAVVHW